MNDFFNTLFEKFLPGWKTRITAILIFLIGIAPAATGVDGGGGILGMLGVDLPMWVYTALYALGLLGVGEKLEAVKTLLKNGAK